MKSAYEVHIGPLPETARLRDQWIALEAHSKASYFISWAWIGSWLELIGDRHADARLVSVHRDAATVALGVITARRRFLGLGPLHVRLHEIGDQALDNLTIEYNGLLAQAGHEKPALTAVVEHMARHDKRWLTFYLPGVDVDDVDFEGLQSSALELRTRLRATHFVDLKPLRAGDGDYLAVLPSKVRSSVRSTQRRLASAFGAVGVDKAANLAQKREFFADLVRLHQAYWASRGDGGAFTDPRILQFHDRLIGMSGDGMGIQLLRLRAGSHVVGYVYNIVWRNRAYYYQAGIDYAGCGHLGSPGLLLLSHAVQGALADGLDRYEFMAGDARYKRKLGTGEGKMAWLSIDRIGWASRARHVWWSMKRSGSY